MAIVDIALLKKHVRADDFSDDDEYLEHLLEAAEDYVLRATNVSSPADLLVGGALPAPLKHAVLTLAGHWYNQREAVSSVQMMEAPYTLQALLKPYRRLVCEQAQ